MRTPSLLACSLLFLLLLPSLGSAHWWKRHSVSLPDDLNFSGRAKGSVYAKEYHLGNGPWQRHGRWHKSLVSRGTGDFCATTFELEEPNGNEPNGNVTVQRLAWRTGKNGELSLCPIVIETNDGLICLEWNGPLTVRCYKFASYFHGTGRALVQTSGENLVPDGIPVKVSGLIVRRHGAYYLAGKVHGYADVTDSLPEDTENITRAYQIVHACFYARGSRASDPILLEPYCECIIDEEAPEITCPSDVTLQCGEDTSPDNTGVPNVFDLCDSDPTVDFTDESVTDPNCPSQVTITRTWTATDASGNESSCTQTITVEDTTPPLITCPPDVTIIDGESIDPNDTGIANASDNCSFADITYSDQLNEANSQITRTWTATDACGNQASCTQTITIEQLPEN